MADNDSTELINLKKPDSFDDAYMALVRAKGIVDMIYMLSLSESKMESLMKSSMTNSLDTVLSQLREVEGFFDSEMEKRIAEVEKRIA